jgi:hypothetical protein
MTRITTFEEALKNPAHQDMWEAMRFLENHDDEILFPEKFLASNKESIRQKIQYLHKQSPAISLKTALFEVLKDIPENIPANLLLEFTSFAIEQWETHLFPKAVEKNQTPTP